MGGGAGSEAPPSRRNSRRGSFMTCLQLLVASSKASALPDKHFRGSVDDRRAAQVAHLVRGVERRGAVHGAAVVPDSQVPDLPLVAIDKLPLRREFHQYAEQSLALLDRHSDHVP